MYYCISLLPMISPCYLKIVTTDVVVAAFFSRTGKYYSYPQFPGRSTTLWKISKEGEIFPVNL
jgi:hypothetical protein